MNKWKIIRIIVGVIFAVTIVATLDIYLKPLPYGYAYESNNGHSSYIFYEDGTYKYFYTNFDNEVIETEFKYTINANKTEMDGLAVSKFNHFEIILEDGSIYFCKSATRILVVLIFWYIILTVFFVLSFAWEKGETEKQSNK